MFGLFEKKNEAQSTERTKAQKVADVSEAWERLQEAVADVRLCDLHVKWLIDKGGNVRGIRVIELLYEGYDGTVNYESTEE